MSKRYGLDDNIKTIEDNIKTIEDNISFIKTIEDNIKTIEDKFWTLWKKKIYLQLINKYENDSYKFMCIK